MTWTVPKPVPGRYAKPFVPTELTDEMRARLQRQRDRAAFNRLVETCAIGNAALFVLACQLPFFIAEGFRP